MVLYILLIWLSCSLQGLICTNASESNTATGRCEVSSLFDGDYFSDNLECGGMHTRSTGSFTPADWYPANVSCKWVICAELGKFILVPPIEFWLMENEQCESEYLEICDGCHYTSNASFIKGKKYRFCGEGSSPQIISASGIITVSFQAGQEKPVQLKEPFEVAYEIFDYDPQCGGVFSNENGSIQTPGYPQTRPNEVQCFWEISMPIGQRINFTVYQFTTHPNSDCADKLQIVDGVNLKYPKIFRYTATSPPRKHFCSNSNLVKLIFSSDDCKDAQLIFKITWKATKSVYRDTIYSSSGILVTPNFLNKWEQIDSGGWFIYVNQGNVIRFTFLDWESKVYSSDACKTSNLGIVEGDDDNYVVLGKWCYTKDFPTTIQTSTASAMVILTSHPNRLVRISFRLSYEAVCTRTLKGFHGVIESINFPNLYPPNVQCSWVIKVGANFDLVLNFTNFNLRSDTWNEDFVEIISNNGETSNSSKVVAKYVEVKTLPHILKLTGNSIEIKFQSYNQLTHMGTGFRLNWKLEGCGGELNGIRGSFQSENYPHMYAHNSHCKWGILTTADSRVVLTIHKFAIENSTNCKFDGLKIYDGPDDAFNLLAFFCGDDDSPKVLTSTYNKMFLEFFSDDSINSQGFNASYEQIRAKNDMFCGGAFSGPSGYIYSPNYPKHYNNLDDCTWMIKVDPNYLAALSIFEYDIEDKFDTGCQYDNLTIYDQHLEYEISLAIFCGIRTTPETIVSSGNLLLLRFRSSYVGTGKGFKAKYFQTCGAVLNNDSGLIQSPQFMSIMNGANNCSWVIRTDIASSRIVLLFTAFSWPIADEFCTEHYIRIYDGEKREMPELPFLYTGCCSHVPPPLISSGSIMTLETTNAEALKFTALYFIIPEDCVKDGAVDLNPDESIGNIDEGNASNNNACSKEFKTGTNLVTIHFQPYMEELHHDYCDTNFVEVNNDDILARENEHYCRHEIPKGFVDETWIVHIKSEQSMKNETFHGGSESQNALEVANNITSPENIATSTYAFTFEKSVFLFLGMYISFL